MTLTALSNDNGTCYIDLSTVIAIDAPVQKKGRSPARSVVLNSGRVVYIHDSRENFLVFAPILPEGAEPWGPKLKAAKKVKAPAKWKPDYALKTSAPAAE